MSKPGLENIVKSENPELKKKAREFDIGHLLGTIGSYAGTAGLAFLTNNYTNSPYLSAAVGSSIGDYLGYEAGFTPYWYLKNTQRYKGLSGKWKFTKDWTSFTLKSLPLEIATYAVSVPLAIGATYLTGNPVVGAVASGAVLDVAYWLGLRTLNKRKIREVAEEGVRYNHKPAYAH